MKYLCLFLAAWMSMSCARKDGSDAGSGDTDSSDGKSTADGDADTDADGDTDSDGDGDSDPVGPVCETASTEAELAPIFLAVIFDVSGSMGHLDRPNWWHDPVVKWKPVVEVVSSFFEDADSSGISAALTLFPSAGTDTEKCDASTYQTPDVEMTELPSDSFVPVFTAYEAEVGTPLAGGNWRGGTPTAAAFDGTAVYLADFVALHEDAKFAMVLVTDGFPAGCGEQNTLAAVEARIAAHHLDTGISTYVIGIENPTAPPFELPSFWPDWGCGTDNNEPCSAPDGLDDLHLLASAGGTQSAFLIDTGDPLATQAAFREAIDQIRLKTVSCELKIPDHPMKGMVFEKDKIDVSMSTGGTSTPFRYDPDCGKADAWRYDDEDDPAFIVLCPTTCERVRSERGASVNVNFLCEIRIDIY